MKNEQQKRYGQNFLTSKAIWQKVIQQMDLSSEDTVYEIGCGKGHLTRNLILQVTQVYGFEIDEILFKKLEVTFGKFPQLTLICENIQKFKFPMTGAYKIVGNIPFNLSTEILKNAILASNASECYFIVEQGFALRMTRSKATIVTCLLQTQAEIEYLMTIDATAFHPKPTCHGALIKIVRKTQPEIGKEQLPMFERFLRQFFSGKRNNLFTKNQWYRAKQHASIKNNGDNLTVEQVVQLFKSYLLFSN